MEKLARILVAGGSTLIGAALLRELGRQGFAHATGGTRPEPDWSDAAQVDECFGRLAPEYLFVAAGKSGGIGANQTRPAELMLDNLLVECNLIHAAYRHRVKKLLYLASSCCYPRGCPQPMKEDALLTGPLEPTNEAYAVAKIAGIKLCEAYRWQYRANFIVGIPANAFGPGDDFGLEDSHVISALMVKMHHARIAQQPWVEMWGTGTPRREFIYADDLADACIFTMGQYEQADPINLGGGLDLAIAELAAQIKQVVGYRGELRFDPSKPDGMPLKVLDSSKLRKMGWWPRNSFQEALAATYHGFVQNQPNRAVQ